MKQAFIIMQIGNDDLDQVCEKSIVPALIDSDLDPKRVDIHNEGDLLNNEIIKFIEQSEIIVADLTNERPNCYLEIGYAMGIDKFKNLILTAREDHNIESPNHKPNGPKVHFDLTGYDILYWDPNKIEEFKKALEKKIKRRLAVISKPESKLKVVWDQDWLKKHREIALLGLKNARKTGYMEISSYINRSEISVSPSELLLAADNSQIHTFGWPIGVVLTGNDDFSPYPTNEGIQAEISSMGHYDYWILRRNGDFYFLASLFEDGRSKNEIFYNTRIVRICETILHSIRLYTHLNVSRSDTTINIRMKHSGLKDRKLTGGGNWRLDVGNYVSKEPISEIEISGSLENLEDELEEKVKEIAEPLFMLFNFFKVQENIYTQIIEDFIGGRIK